MTYQPISTDDLPPSAITVILTASLALLLSACDGGSSIGVPKPEIGVPPPETTQLENDSSQGNTAEIVAPAPVVNGYHLISQSTSYASGYTPPADIYELDIENRAIRSFELSSNGEKTPGRIYFFDENGLIVREESVTFGQYFENTFDSNKRLVSEQSYNTVDDNIVSFLQSSHNYDSVGLRTSKVVTFSETGALFSTTDLSYNEDNKPIRSTLSSPLLSTADVNVFRYSDDGQRLIEIETVSSISDFALGTSVFEYDTNGNVYTETRYSNEGVFRSQTTYTYAEVNSAVPNLVLHEIVYEPEIAR